MSDESKDKKQNKSSVDAANNEQEASKKTKDAESVDAVELDNAEDFEEDLEDATDAEIGILSALAKCSADNKELESKLKAKENDYLRSLADMQNLQKRMQDQVAKARDFAVESFSKDLLAVIDSLEKATESANAKDNDIEQHIAGVQMVLDLMNNVVGKHSIKKIDAKAGQIFNPDLHLAMSAIEDEEKEDNSILEVFQSGYSLKDRVIRAAMVSVVKKTDIKKADVKKTEEDS